MKWISGSPNLEGYYWILGKILDTDNYSTYLTHTYDGLKFELMGREDYHEFYDILAYSHLPINIPEPKLIRTTIITTEQGVIIPSIGFFDWGYMNIYDKD